MTLARFRAKNHPQQVDRVGANDSIDDRATDPGFFLEVATRLGPFELDVAAAWHNAMCDRFYSLDDDGLSQAWDGRVWCNPPYSNIEPWIVKAWGEWTAGRSKTITMLLPANRTEQGWWQRRVEPFRDRVGSPLRTEFVAGRLRFVLPGDAGIRPNSRPPFGCVLLTWR